MKKRHKMIALLLAMTMCSTAFAGCGADKANNSTTSAEKELPSTEAAGTETSETSGTEMSETPVEPLTNVDIYPLESDKTFRVIIGSTVPWLEKGSGIVPDLMEEVTGVSIDYVGMTYEQFQLALSTKELPDAVFRFSGGLDKTTAREYGQGGYLVDFSDYLDIMPNFSALIEADPKILDYIQNEDGSIYMLPEYQLSSTGSNNLLYHRTDMMKAIGWENPPSTTDEFLQYIIELQEHFGALDSEFIAFNGYQASHMTWNALRFPNYFFASFGELLKTDLTVNSDNKVVLGAATEQYKHYLEFMKEVWDSGAFNTNIYTQDATASKALSAGNHVAITSVTSGFTIDNFESGNIDLEVLAPLTSEYWDTPHWCMPSPVSLKTTSVISTKCEDIETMVKWFDAWYSSVDNPLNKEGTVFGAVTWLGEMGVDFAVDEENMTYAEMEHEGIELGKFGTTQAFGGCLYNGYSGGKFPYSMELTTVLGAKSQGTVNNLWPYGEIPLDFSVLSLTQDETDLYADAWTDINAYIVEMTAKFITGELSIEQEWDNYLSYLEKMGLKDVTDAYQAAYDRYLTK